MQAIKWRRQLVVLLGTEKALVQNLIPTLTFVSQNGCIYDQGKNFSHRRQWPDWR
jgi:hypothetical protein